MMTSEELLTTDRQKHALYTKYTFVRNTIFYSFRSTTPTCDLSRPPGPDRSH